jgi:hypothetical protein
MEKLICLREIFGLFDFTIYLLFTSEIEKCLLFGDIPHFIFGSGPKV